MLSVMAVIIVTVYRVIFVQPYFHKLFKIEHTYTYLFKISLIFSPFIELLLMQPATLTTFTNKVLRIQNKIHKNLVACKKPVYDML